MCTSLVEEFGATSKCHLDTSSQEVGLVTVGFGTKHKPFGPFANPKGNRVKKKVKGWHIHQSLHKFMSITFSSNSSIN
jgi:hypothetical protein